jgi:hypothetical protein
MISVQSTSDWNERCSAGAQQSRTSVNFAIVAPCTTVMTTPLLPSLVNRVKGRLNVEIGKTTGSEK